MVVQLIVAGACLRPGQFVRLSAELVPVVIGRPLKAAMRRQHGFADGRDHLSGRGELTQASDRSKTTVKNSVSRLHP